MLTIAWLCQKLAADCSNVCDMEESTNISQQEEDKFLGGVLLFLRFGGSHMQ